MAHPSGTEALIVSLTDEPSTPPQPDATSAAPARTADTALAMVRDRRVSSGSLLHAACRGRVGDTPGEVTACLDRLDRPDVRGDLTVLQPLLVDLLRGGDELLPLGLRQAVVPDVVRRGAERRLGRLREGGALVQVDGERGQVLRGV